MDEFDIFIFTIPLVLLVLVAPAFFFNGDADSNNNTEIVEAVNDMDIASNEITLQSQTWKETQQTWHDRYVERYNEQMNKRGMF